MNIVDITRDIEQRVVRVIPRHAYRADDISVPRAHCLRFPAYWAGTPVRNRFASCWGDATLAWLGRFGMGKTPEEAHRLSKFVCGDYGGYSFPTANYAAGLLVTQYISLWLFWDDVQVEDETGFDVDAVVHALGCCCGSKRSTRYLRAWTDLGERLRQTQSEAWVQGLCAAMRHWLDNAKQETAMAQAYAEGGRCPSWEETMRCRMVSIGMYPTYWLDEFVCGFELDGEVRRHPMVLHLQRLAARLVGLGNDLGGLAKDLQTRWINVVPVLSESEGIPLEQAFRRVVEIHNADVLEFDRTAAALPSFGRDMDLLVSAWIDTVRHNVYGFTFWESMAERYQEWVALVGRTALLAPVMTFENPTGYCGLPA